MIFKVFVIYRKNGVNNRLVTECKAKDRIDLEIQIGIKLRQLKIDNVISINIIEERRG